MNSWIISKGYLMCKLLKKVGIYVAIVGIFSAIIILFVLRIVRSRTHSGGTSDIDQHINGIQSGIAEADKLNKRIQEDADIAAITISDSTELNIELADNLEEASGSIDRLTEASNQLAELVQRLQERAKEENT